jgi:hypothetical protein
MDKTLQKAHLLLIILVYDKSAKVGPFKSYRHLSKSSEMVLASVISDVLFFL